MKSILLITDLARSRAIWTSLSFWWWKRLISTFDCGYWFNQNKCSCAWTASTCKISWQQKYDAYVKLSTFLQLASRDRWLKSLILKQNATQTMKAEWEAINSSRPLCIAFHKDISYAFYATIILCNYVIKESRGVPFWHLTSWTRDQSQTVSEEFSDTAKKEWLLLWIWSGMIQKPIQASFYFVI